MSKNVVDTSLPQKHDTEDKIFNNCNVEIEEFTEFILNVQEYHDFFKSWMNCIKQILLFKCSLMKFKQSDD